MNRARSGRVAKPRLVLLGAGAAFALACMSDEVPRTPTMPWNQAAVTQAAGAFATEMANLYTTAYKDPSFAGERTAYASTLNTLRELEEESAGLHDELKDGKGYQETLTRFERIKELVRDADESAAWEFVEEDLATRAKTALGTIRTLDGYYGDR